MSLSETSPFRKVRRNPGPFIALLLTLPAGGCFQPLYGEAAHPGLTAEMRGIAIAPIPDRIGHYLGNDLSADLNGTGAAPTPKYRLTVTTSISEQTPTVTSQLQEANAATVTGTADYTLASTADGTALFKGSATSATVYDRTINRFSNLRARRDAEIKLAKSLAEEIELRIAAKFTGPRTGGIKGEGNKCIDIPQGNTTDGTKLNYWDCDGSAEQEWTMDNGAIVGQDGKCLDIPGGATADGTVLDIKTCVAGAPEQTWAFKNGAIVGKGGKCVELLGGKTENGTPIALATCNGGANQRWDYGALVSTSATAGQ